MHCPRCLNWHNSLLHGLLILVLIPAVVAFLSALFGAFVANAEGWPLVRGIWYSAGAFTITTTPNGDSFNQVKVDDADTNRTNFNGTDFNETQFRELMEKPRSGSGCLAALTLHLTALGFIAFELALAASLPFVSILSVFIGCRYRRVATNIASFILYTGILTPLGCISWATVLAVGLCVVDPEYSDKFPTAWRLALGNLTRCWSLDPLTQRPTSPMGRLWHVYVSCNCMVLVVGLMVGVMRHLRISRMVANIFIYAAKRHKGWICRLGRPYVCLQFIGIPMTAVPMLVIVAPVFVRSEHWTASQAVAYVSSSITLMPTGGEYSLGERGTCFDFLMSCFGIGFFAFSIAVVSELPLLESIVRKSGVQEEGILVSLKAFSLSSFVVLPLAFGFIALVMAPVLMILESRQPWRFTATWLHIVDMMLLSPGTMARRKYAAKTLVGRVVSEFCQFWSLSLALGNGIAVWRRSNPVQQIVHLMINMSGDNPDDAELPEDMGIRNADGTTFYPQNMYVSNLIFDKPCTCCQDSDSDSNTVDPDEEADFRNRQFLAAYMSLNKVLNAWMEWELSDHEALKHANYFLARIQWLGDIDTNIARNLLKSQGLTDTLRRDIERKYEELVRHCGGKCVDSP